MRKKWIRGGIFLCLVLLLLNNLNRILCVKSPHGVDQTRYLYVQPKIKSTYFSGQQPRSLQREYAAALGRIRHGSVPDDRRGAAALEQLL